MQYRKEIDGLRALAVIPVMLYHAGVPFFTGGFVGVDIFFVISGYLITSIIIYEMNSASFTLIKFYERRARRLLPALFVLIIFTFIASFFFMYPYQLVDLSRSIITVIIFSSNFFFWRESGGYFGGLAEEMPLIHTWSLAVEEQFYLIFPIFILLFWKFKNKVMIAIILITIICSFVLAQYASFYHPRPNFYLIPTRAWEILIGSFIAFIIYEKDRTIKNKWNSPLSLMGIIMICISIFLYDKETAYPSFFTLLPVLGTVLIIIFSSNNDFVGKILSAKYLVFIGLISYSAYLWHQPIIALARISLENEYSSSVGILICVFTFLLSYVSWKIIEMPFRKKKLVSSKQFILIMILSTVLLLFASVTTINSKGFQSRWSDADIKILKVHPMKSGKYTREKFNQLKGNNLKDSNKKNILIIGDSYAQDFVNIIYETKMDTNVNISTHHIMPRCGNLFIEKEKIISLEKYRKKRCYKEKYYSLELQKKMKLANVIILSSSWEKDEVEYLPESIENIKKITKAKVVVIGTKAMPLISKKELLKINVDERKEKKISGKEWRIFNEHVETNKDMIRILENYNFINLHKFLFDKNGLCKVFDKNLDLITYDGSHLLRSGALYVGGLIKNNKLIQEIFN